MTDNYLPEIYVWSVRLLVADAHFYDFNAFMETMPHYWEDVSCGIEQGRIYVDIKFSLGVRNDGTGFMVRIGEVIQAIQEATNRSYIKGT